MKIKRRKTKIIKVGNISIGSGCPIAIQSMVKTDTKDIDATIKQIEKAKKEGAHLMRVAVKDKRQIDALKEIKHNIDIPLIADIHFDYRLALAAIDSGVDKIRLNPGNIYKEKHIREVAASARDRYIPIRVGVNSGSLRKEASRGADSLVKSALDFIKKLEKFGFYDIIISLKSSNLIETVQANREIAKLTDYPLHVGVTATGSRDIGILKSAICLGMLLSEGIGDTIRVSLTAPVAQEVIIAKRILVSLDIDNKIDLIACPTCGRCEVDLVGIVRDLDQELKKLNSRQNFRLSPLRIAIMGCEVNGPGEAKYADLGIAFGKDYGLFFKKGKKIKKVKQAEAAKFLKLEIKRMLEETKRC